MNVPQVLAWKPVLVLTLLVHTPALHAKAKKTHFGNTIREVEIVVLEVSKSKNLLYANRSKIPRRLYFKVETIP